MSARSWTISEALESARSLAGHLDELTEEEVLAALELESGTSRRSSIIDRLISRAVRLNELKYKQSLKEKYHGTYRIESSVRR